MNRGAMVIQHKKDRETDRETYKGAKVIQHTKEREGGNDDTK